MREQIFAPLQSIDEPMLGWNMLTNLLNIMVCEAYEYNQSDHVGRTMSTKVMKVVGHQSSNMSLLQVLSVRYMCAAP